MKNRLRYYWVSFKMFWLSFSLFARIFIIAAPILYALLIIFSPDRQFWILLCVIGLVLSPLTILAVYMLFREIK